MVANREEGHSLSRKVELVGLPNGGSRARNIDGPVETRRLNGIGSGRCPLATGVWGWHLWIPAPDHVNWHMRRGMQDRAVVD